eukprot:TRINITY_DN865_c0_g1_i1.p2 TRINITY_DN865_c0_g1~~TRINITY_DN865_c0_g1_i1.p2  ORF type:complete len:464 (+),score=195.14 TRINITY_DN865_c0_g1_i1:52-1443(+)
MSELYKRIELSQQLTKCGMNPRQVKTLTMLRITSTSTRRDIEGVYEMMDHAVNDNPIWGKAGKRLYCGTGQLWIFGDEDDVAAQRGRVRSAERGKSFPTECTAWQQADGQGGWEAMPDRLKVELAHSIDVSIQPREMSCPINGEKLCLYDQDLDQLVCHVCALTGRSVGHQMMSIDEFMSRTIGKVNDVKRKNADAKDVVNKCRTFFQQLQNQKYEYDKMKQQVQGSIEAAIEYLRQEEQKELARIDAMKERNERVFWEKISEAEVALGELNSRIDTADAVLEETHPPAFHRRAKEFFDMARDDVPLPPIESTNYENYTPQIHTLPLHRVVPPVGTTVRIPQSTLLLTEGQTDVGNVCFMGLFFELHLKHSPTHMGVFLHCPICDPVYVTMEWALDIVDLNREPLITTKVADGKFPKDSAIGWQNAISLDTLRRHPAVELSIDLRSIAYDLAPPNPTLPSHAR